MKLVKSFIVALIISTFIIGGSAFAQTTTATTSSSSSASSEKKPSFLSSFFGDKKDDIGTEADINSHLEEIRGVIEGVGTDRLPINIMTDKGLEVRIIRYGAKDAITVTRDSSSVSSIETLEPGDAVVVLYGTSAVHEGKLAEGTSATKIVLTDNDGVTKTFTSFEPLSLRYIYSKDDKAVIGATVEGKAGISAIIPALKIGTPVTITYSGESIYSVDSYSSGKIPGVSKDQQVIAENEMSPRTKKMLALGGLIVVILAGWFGYRQYRTRS